MPARGEPLHRDVDQAGFRGDLDEARQTLRVHINRGMGVKNADGRTRVDPVRDALAADDDGAASSFEGAGDEGRRGYGFVLAIIDFEIGNF